VNVGDTEKKAEQSADEHIGQRDAGDQPTG
jgi:hypothetical protein